MNNPFEEFLISFVESIGGLIEKNEDGQTYTIAYGDEPVIKKIAFTAEAIKECPDAQIMTLGSPLLDEFISSACSRGMISQIFIYHPPSDEKLLDFLFDRTYKIMERKDSAWEKCKFNKNPFKAVNLKMAMFRFKVVLKADITQEQLLTATVNMNSLRMVRKFEDIIKKCQVFQEPFEKLSDFFFHDIFKCYQEARNWLAKRLVSIVKRVKYQIEEFKRREISRVENYCNGLQEEIKLKFSKSTNPIQKPLLESRLRTIFIEKERLLSDIETRYKLNAYVKLVSLLIVNYRGYVRELVDIGGLQRKIDIIYNPLLGHLEPVNCPNCKKPIYELILWRRILGCPNCLTVS